jgi:hypothetical protein
MGTGTSTNLKAIVKTEGDRAKYIWSLDECCLSYNIEDLIKLWPELIYEELNAKTTQGDTPLHKACAGYNFACIGVLLAWGAATNIKDNNGRTAFERISIDEEHLLVTRRDKNNKYFLAQIMEKDLRSFRQSDEWIPNNDYIRGHRDVNSATYVKEMIKIFRGTDVKNRVRKYMTHDLSFKRLHQILKSRFSSNSEEYGKVKSCLIKDDFIHLIKLYTVDMKYYRKIGEEDAVFTSIAFANLSKFRDCSFRGRSYRGIVLHPFDLEAYQWANVDDGRVIEFRQFTSSSKCFAVAEAFADPGENNHDRMGVLITFEFPNECDTTIDLDKVPVPEKDKEHISQFQDEKEILILPYTLFKVANFTKSDDSKRCEITLINVPVVT